jgi:hypothetical protein
MGSSGCRAPEPLASLAYCGNLDQNTCFSTSSERREHIYRRTQYPQITAYSFLNGFYAFCITLYRAMYNPLTNVASIIFT